jgi:thiamine-monophosphate kinase
VTRLPRLRAPATEPQLVEWLRRYADPGIGDDAAILPLSGEWMVTVDAQHEGIHLPPGLDPALAAQRLVAVNLSDVAAMGGRPASAFLSLAAPTGYERQRFLVSLIDACARYDVSLLGGDNSKLGALSTTLTVLARRWPRGRWLRRCSARPGDGLWAGGVLGEAALGLVLLSQLEIPERGLPLPGLPKKLLGPARRALRRQLRPEPQLELGRALSRRERVACIDCSDGLGIDLARLCAASGVGVELEASRIPNADRALAEHLKLDPLELALAGGEDYVLLFTLPARARPPVGDGITRIGRIVEDTGVIVIDHAGDRVDISDRGFDHIRAIPAGAHAIRAPAR